MILKGAFGQRLSVKPTSEHADLFSDLLSPSAKVRTPESDPLKALIDVSDSTSLYPNRVFGCARTTAQHRLIRCRYSFQTLRSEGQRWLTTLPVFRRQRRHKGGSAAVGRVLLKWLIWAFDESFLVMSMNVTVMKAQIHARSQGTTRAMA